MLHSAETVTVIQNKCSRASIRIIQSNSNSTGAKKKLTFNIEDTIRKYRRDEAASVSMFTVIVQHIFFRGFKFSLRLG